uniref:Uncharacterized protein n=1 Tax=Lepeophtheirus salmonis TaxID=72036 RepID=A0A0K2V5F2_LEPSM
MISSQTLISSNLVNGKPVKKLILLSMIYIIFCLFPFKAPKADVDTLNPSSVADEKNLNLSISALGYSSQWYQSSCFLIN